MQTRYQVSFRALALLAGLLLSAGTALGALTAVESAYELLLSNVSLPGNETGQLTLRPCSSCSPQVLRVSPGTEYMSLPAKEPLSLTEFRERAGKVLLRNQAAVYVYYDPATGQVRRLVLDEFRR